MEIRLQKYLAESGICSRRKAEELILAGRVKVNNAIVTELGTKVDGEKDKISLDGNPVKMNRDYVYIMLHKPVGYITAVTDQFDRPTVLDLLKDIPARLFPVGRLDYDTSGLLILTNDGDLTFKLTHPKHNIDKIYIARIKGAPTDEEMYKFRSGVVIDGYQTKPASIEILKKMGSQCTVRIKIGEGRNRQIRKMLEAIGHETINLKRVATGKILLGELPKGEYRTLTKNEIMYLKSV